MTRLYAGYRVLSRIIDGFFIFGIYLMFPKTGIAQEMVLPMLYLLYYGSASFINGITPGRHFTSTALVSEKNRPISFLRIFIREMLFVILLPLIFFQWVIGLEYAHERITLVFQTRSK